MRGSTTGRPIIAVLDLLGRRATLRILWELSLSPRPLTFRALQDSAATNPSVLNTRLKELRDARLVERLEDGYALSTDGLSLLAVFGPLHAWAETWATQVAAKQTIISKKRQARD